MKSKRHAQRTILPARCSYCRLPSVGIKEGEPRCHLHWSTEDYD